MNHFIWRFYGILALVQNHFQSRCMVLNNEFLLKLIFIPEESGLCRTMIDIDLRRSVGSYLFTLHLFNDQAALFHFDDS